MPPSSVLPSTAAGDIIAYVRERCRLGSNPPGAAFQDESMLAALHDINDWFVYWPLSQKGVTTPWKFTRREKLYTTVAYTTLNGGISSGANTFTLTDGSSFFDPGGTQVGAVAIRDSLGGFDFATYEERASNVCSDVAGIDLDHASGEEVHMLYPLPTNYGRMRAVKVNGREYAFTDDEFEDFPSPGKWASKYLTSANGGSQFFLLLPFRFGGGQRLKVWYVKKPNTINDEDDEVDAPDGLARWAIIRKFEAFVWEQKGESVLAQAAAEDAERYCDQFAAVQASESASPDQGPTFGFDI